MFGIAKKKYLEKGGRVEESGSTWPFLEKLVDEGTLLPAAYFFAKSTLKEIDDENIAAFICYIFMANCDGHLCVHIDEKRLDPSPVPWLGKESLEMIRAGSQKASNFPQIVQSKNLFYLQKNWFLENLFLENLERIKNCTPKIKFDSKDHPNLSEEQNKAVKICCENSLTLISGGPGTGKTYTVKYLIQTLLKSTKKPLKIVLTAPTGKALSNLQKDIDLPDITVKTLHALLKWRQYKSNFEEQSYIDADLIIVDESAMVDIAIMTRLLSSVRDGARIVFLGDKDQLPPITQGSPFADMMSLELSKIALTNCMRTNKDMSDFADLINHGKSDEVINIGKYRDIEKEDILSYTTPFYSSLKDENPEELFKDFFHFKLLSPLRQGPYGVDALNNLIWKKMGHVNATPIIITKNDYRMDLYNGETGFLLKKQNIAIFKSRNEESSFFDKKTKMRRIPSALLPSHEYAYCLSVHKSQGSEFDHVLLLLPEGSETFGRKMLYTAVTRARSSFEIWGNKEIIKATIDNQNSRKTRIQDNNH